MLLVFAPEARTPGKTCDPDAHGRAQTQPLLKTPPIGSQDVILATLAEPPREKKQLFIFS